MIKHIFLLFFVLGCCLAACSTIPNIQSDKALWVKSSTMWSDIQRYSVICMDGGGYAQMHRQGNEPVSVWCFEENK